jgi:hypothetical protein
MKTNGSFANSDAIEIKNDQFAVVRTAESPPAKEGTSQNGCLGSGVSIN